ncbi:glutaminase A [Isosphaeraceae bacterium EP7]
MVSRRPCSCTSDRSRRPSTCTKPVNTTLPPLDPAALIDLLSRPPTLTESSPAGSTYAREHSLLSRGWTGLSASNTIDPPASNPCRVVGRPHGKRIPLAIPTSASAVSTAPDRLRTSVAAAHERFRSVNEGEVASYIPALAKVPAGLFGVCVVETSGAVHSAGDSEHEFSIQSVSKPFVFALVCQAIGEDEARRKLGVNSTGLPFNSVIAIERTEDGTTNPMVNAGAIAAASLAPGATAAAKWQFLQEGLSRFAGRRLTLDAEVYESESATNRRNEVAAKLLQSYDRIFFDPIQSTDIYTRQCSLNVNARDLAAMAATLANGGVNPLTGEPVIDAIHCQHVLAVMVTAGLYENSGDWLYETGLPGKSGVSGGMVAVAPGKGGLGTFSPPLDPSGNSVRGRLAAGFLSEQLGLNLFASHPAGR